MSRTIATMLVLAALFSIGLLLSVATLDPLSAMVTSYDLGGMESQVLDIHEAAVKWLVPAGLGSLLLWAVFRLLRTERQQV